MTEILTQELSFGRYKSGIGTEGSNVRRLIWIEDFPLTLFAGGIAGAWYDPSDLTTLFQDSAGTTPVTTTGQPVGKMLDKSGNGNHVIQATAGKRPVYTVLGGTAYLAFDGVDDNLSVNSASLRLLGNLTLSAAAYKNGSSTFGGILCCETNAATVAPYEWRFSNHVTVLQPEFVSADGASVLQRVADGPGDVGVLATNTVVSLRRNIGVNIEHSSNKSRFTYAFAKIPTADAGSAFMIGNRSSDEGIPFGGRFFGGLIHSTRLSDADLARLETYLGAKAGLAI